MIIPVLSQTPFNFSYLASSATEDVIVADRVPVSNARTISLSVRVHRLTLSSGANFQFLVYGMDPSSTDGTVFVTSATIGGTGAVTSSNPNLVGLTSIISDPIYPFVRVVLRATGPTTTGSCYMELSADLVVRQAAGFRKGKRQQTEPMQLKTQCGGAPAGMDITTGGQGDTCFCVQPSNPEVHYKWPCGSPCYGPGFEPAYCKGNDCSIVWAPNGCNGEDCWKCIC